MRFQPAVHVRETTVVVVVGLMGSLGVLRFTYALTYGESSVIVTITALYPLITTRLLIVLLKEAPTPRQGIGIVLRALVLLPFAT